MKDQIYEIQDIPLLRVLNSFRVTKYVILFHKCILTKYSLPSTTHLNKNFALKSIS